VESVTCTFSNCEGVRVGFMPFFLKNATKTVMSLRLDIRACQ
jgi:hypothetical protein